MLKNTNKVLLLFATLTLAATSIFAQSEETFQKQIEKMVALAEQTATFENGKIKTVKIITPEGEKLISFEHSSDNRSFTIIDEQNQRIQVFLVDSYQIGSVRMPDDAEALFVYGEKKLDKIVFKQNGVELFDALNRADNCRDAAERAGAAAAIAIGVCAADPTSTRRAGPQLQRQHI